MANFCEIIEEIRRLGTLSDKTRFLTVILNSFQNKRVKIIPEDKRELSDFAFGEIKFLTDFIPTIQSYKEKDEAFGYVESILGIIMLCFSSPAEIGEAKFSEIKALTEIVSKERFVENSIEDIFRNSKNDEAFVKEFLSTVSNLDDEYQKGMLYQGLLSFQDSIGGLPSESRKLFADHIFSEIKRYLDTTLDEVIINNLEIACDVAKYFINADMIAVLKDVLKIGKNNVNYYAVATLLNVGEAVPSNVIADLANDLEYAELTYSQLKKYGKTDMFPVELNDPVYLAKSDLVRWLTYPTELGKQPDKIEFLGKVKKRSYYYVFRYMSDSDNLDEDIKEKWLIGWSNDDGGTFSNFDLYSDFEKKTIEKTLKFIRRRLL